MPRVRPARGGSGDRSQQPEEALRGKLPARTTRATAAFGRLPSCWPPSPSTRNRSGQPRLLRQAASSGSLGGLGFSRSRSAGKPIHSAVLGLLHRGRVDAGARAPQSRSDLRRGFPGPCRAVRPSGKDGFEPAERVDFPPLAGAERLHGYQFTSFYVLAEQTGNVEVGPKQ